MCAPPRCSALPMAVHANQLDLRSRRWWHVRLGCLADAFPSHVWGAQLYVHLTVARRWTPAASAHSGTRVYIERLAGRHPAHLSANIDPIVWARPLGRGRCAGVRLSKRVTALGGRGVLSIIPVRPGCRYTTQPQLWTHARESSSLSPQHCDMGEIGGGLD